MKTGLYYVGALTITASVAITGLMALRHWNETERTP